MKPWAVVVGIIIAVVGLVGLLSPDTYVRLGWFWATSQGLYIVAAIQLACALILLSAAPSSRSPVGLGVVAGVTLVEAVAMPLLGPARDRAIAEWWGSQTAGFIRLWALLELVVGILVVCAVAPGRRSLGRVAPAR